MFPHPTAPIVARQNRGQETQLRGQGTQRYSRNILRGFREAALQFKEFEMGRKTEPVVIDSIREELSIVYLLWNPWCFSTWAMAWSYWARLVRS